MNQLTIFDVITPRARRADPETSHVAAAKAATFAVSHRNRIMAALDEPGTPHEIAARAGLDYWAVQRRMKELLELGLAKPTTEKRDGCRVWGRV